MRFLLVTPKTLTLRHGIGGLLTHQIKGAFTDAKSAHSGLFAQANAGTLFLDEIGEMALGLQPKLLRALQENVIERLGGNRLIQVDIRIVAATNRNPQEAIKEGKALVAAARAGR